MKKIVMTVMTVMLSLTVTKVKFIEKIEFLQCKGLDIQEDLVREEEIHTDGEAADQMGETESESDVEVDAEVTEAQAEITDAEVEVTDAEAEIAEAEITDAEAEVAEVEIAVAEVDAEVTEALAHVSSISDINVELSSHDIQEKDSVVTFMEAGCHCKLWNGKGCSLQYSPSEVEEVRLICLALSKSELDMVVMGQIMANSNSSAITEASKHLPLARKKKYTKYFHQGKAVCPAMFHFLHSIGETKLKNLVGNFKDDGLSPRTHGNTKKLPHNTLSISSVEFVVRFLLNYADQNGILLPGCIPGYRGQISSFFPLAYPNVQLGECTRNLLILLVMFIL